MTLASNPISTKKIKQPHIETKLLENEKKISAVLKSNLVEHLKREVLNNLYQFKRHLYLKLLNPEEEEKNPDGQNKETSLI